MVLDSRGNRFCLTQTQEPDDEVRWFVILSITENLAASNTTTAKRPDTSLCVLKPDGLVCAVNTILTNHLLEGSMESYSGSVENAYTPVDNVVCRDNQRVVSQAVDFGELWQGFCFHVLHLGQ